MQDLDILIEAVEAWENKDLAGNLMGDLMEGMLTDRRNPSDMERFKAEREERRREQELAKRQRKERSILLRAKLIQMLDTRRSAAMVAEALPHMRVQP